MSRLDARLVGKARCTKRMSVADCRRSRPTGDLNLPAVTWNAGLKPRRDVGVLDHRAALAEIRHELEVVNVTEGAFDRRPHPRRLPGIDHAGRILALEVAPVDVQHAAELELILRIRGFQAEAARARAHDRRRRLRRHGRFVLDLELALEHEDLLFLLLEATKQFLVRHLGLCRERSKRQCGDDRRTQ